MRTILVVDDDMMNLRMAEYILKQDGNEVLLASSGAEGIGVLKNGGVDLVLLDIEMPGMDGIKTLGRIRMERDFVDLPVIFLTASGEKKDILKANVLRAAGYIRKPFLPQDLLDRVHKVFDEE